MKSQSYGTILWLRIARFVQRSNQQSNEFLKQYGLTAAQFDVLAQIYFSQPVIQNELAEKLTVTVGGISRMLTRLEKEGLIKREQKWREKYIGLTDKGETLIKEVIPKQVGFQSSMFEEVLTKEEQKQLYQMVTKLYKHSLKKKLN